MSKDRLSINLLPGEITNQAKDAARKLLITRVSIGFLLFMILISSTALLLRILQNRDLEVTNGELIDARSRVASFKEQEGLIFYLKQRLSSIASLDSQESKQAKSYNLITALAPQKIRISVLTLDKNANVILSCSSPDSATLNTFLDNLSNPQKNEGKISKVKIDSLNRGPDGQFRVDLIITVT